MAAPPIRPHLNVRQRNPPVQSGVVDVAQVPAPLFGAPVPGQARSIFHASPIPASAENRERGMTAGLPLVDSRGRACSLQVRGGRPVVTAFCHSFRAADGATRALRAELRGLGASLVLCTPDEITLIDPDDDLEPLAPAGDVPGAGGARALATAFGVAVDPTRDWCLSVFLCDGDGRPTWSWRSRTPITDEAEVLIAAVGRAATVRAKSWQDLPPGPQGSQAPGQKADQGLSRRQMMGLSAGAALALAFADADATAAVAASGPPSGDQQMVTLDVNGTAHQMVIEPRVSLLDALREHLGLTGTKKGCDHGQCGACTVLVDDRRIVSCLTLAIMNQGAKITTIEGLARGPDLHPMQAAFLQHDAFQCGYCTPGQIVSAVGLLREGTAHSADDVREQMSGNICRCGAYPNIVAAIEHVRKGS
jgi:xanthine dehydrogenase YagT iron-sulfur-binding subunit